MDKELQDYYENRFALTATVGWNDLMIDVDSMIASISDIRNVSEATPVEFRKGQLDILLWLRNLREQAERAYEHIQKDESL